MLSVFRLLCENNINGCGIVDKSGKLIGNLSISDLQVIVKEEGLEYLEEPLSIFQSKHQRPKLVTCKGDDSLIDVICIVASQHVHRAYIVDDSGKPSGVISLTDILDGILALAEGYQVE